MLEEVPVVDIYYLYMGTNYRGARSEAAWRGVRRVAGDTVSCGQSLSQQASKIINNVDQDVDCWT